VLSKRFGESYVDKVSGMSEPKGAVSADDVKKIARLSRGVEPMTSAVDMSAPMRQDEISDGGKRDDILKNAPKKDDGFFVVPRSVE